MQKKIIRDSEPLGGAYCVPFLLIRVLHLNFVSKLIRIL